MPLPIEQVAKLIDDELLGLARSILIRNDKVASGETVKELYTTTERKGINLYQIDLVGPDHTIYTLFGRGPGKQPPLGVIEAWIQDRSLELSAWVVAENIGANGTVAQDFGFFEELEAGIIPFINSQLNTTFATETLLKDLTNSLNP